MWRKRMKTFLQAHGYDVWYSVVTGYIGSKKPKIATKKELKRNNKIAMDFILEGLPFSKSQSGTMFINQRTLG
jgi:hypothetical protein